MPDFNKQYLRPPNGAGLIDRLKQVLPYPAQTVPGLKQKGSSGEYSGPCPKCGGTDRFYVRPDGSFACRQCNPRGGDVVDFYQWYQGYDLNALADVWLTDRQPEEKPAAPKTPKAKAIEANLTKVYSYTDEAGKELFQVCRYEQSGCGKAFRQRQRTPDGAYVSNLKGVRRVIYNLPAVLAAGHVILTEGEKDADTLIALGFVATTTPMGASNWKPEYAPFFKGKHVAIFPDTDEPGERYCKAVLKDLAGVAASIKIVKVPVACKDITDHIETFGATAEQIKQMIASAELHKPKRSPLEPPPPAEMVISRAELLRASLSPRCIVRDYLFADVATIAAPGGTGKTTQLLYEMICIALGRDLWGLEVFNPGWCLYVTAEDSREILVARLREIMKAMELSREDQQFVLGTVLIWDVTGEQTKLITSRDGNIELTPLADNIVSAYREAPPAMVALDPIISFGAGELYVNDNEQGLITAARRVMRGLGCCVRLVAHTGKGNARSKTLDQYTSRGGSALSDGARMVTVLQTWQPGDAHKPPDGYEFEPGTSLTILARPKLSYAAANQPLIWIQRKGWKFEHLVEAALSDAEKEEAFFDQVVRFIASEVKAGVRHSKTSLETAIPNVKRAEARNAIEQLLARRQIIEAELPSEERQGRRKYYLSIPPKSDEESGGIEKNEMYKKVQSADSNYAAAYRENLGGIIEPQDLPTFPNSAGESRQNTAELAE